MSILILNPGHGGIINGAPVTPGKRSPDGQFIEGVFNRNVINKIIEKAPSDFDIETIPNPSDHTDYPLGYIVHKTKKIKGDSFFVSVHADAQPTWYININGSWELYRSTDKAHKEFFEQNQKNRYKVIWHNEWATASGISLFAYSQKSGKIVTDYFAPLFNKNKFDMKLRKPKPTQSYWTGNFAVLRETPMPAMLIESGFMTNKSDVALMNTDKYQDFLADSIIEGARQYFNR